MDFERQLDCADIDGLASAWQAHTRDTVKEQRDSQAAVRRTMTHETPTFSQMYHALMHSNYWRPLVAQENKYAAHLFERSRLGTTLLARVQAAQRTDFKTLVAMEYEHLVNSKKSVRKQESQVFSEDDVDFLMDEGQLRAIFVQFIVILDN